MIPDERKEIRATIRLSVLLFLAVPMAAVAADTPARPNIILIVADDQGYADASFRGSEIETPHLDSLAASGAMLNRFYVCPVCSPTRAGLMTGRYPIRFGMQRAVNRPFSEVGLPDHEETLPELLAMAGYEHRHMVGKWHLGNMRWEHLPLRQGFTSYYGPYCSGIDYFKHTRLGEHDFHRDDETVFEEGYATHLLSAEAVRLIRSHADERAPFFLYLPHSAPHNPTQAPDMEVAAYTKRGLGKAEATYAAMISAIDTGVGDLLRALEETGQRDNTLIIYLSDNGGTRRGSNHPLRGGKGTIYEGGIRVLALADWPGKIPPGTKVDAPCSYIDVVPTLCAVAGVDHPLTQTWDGRDVMPLWQGKTDTDPAWEFFSFYERQGKNKEELSMTTPRFKLIRRGRPILDSSNPSADATLELFNLSTDVSETRDAAEEHPELVKKMLSKMERFRKLRSKVGVGAQPEPAPRGWKPPKNWELAPPTNNDTAPSADITGDSREGFVDLLSADAVTQWVPDGRTENARNNQWSHWTFDENLLHCDGKQYGFIRFDQEVCDFILRLEFRFAAAGGNSGIGIRGMPYREHSTRPSVVAYELQILDEAGKNPSKSGNMSLYHLLAPTDNAMHAAGEWNRLEVICRGPRLTVGLNGKTVQDVDQTQHERLKEKPLCGYILLQNHRHPIDFRNVHLKVLKAPSSNSTNLPTQSNPRRLRGSR